MIRNKIAVPEKFRANNARDIILNNYFATIADWEHFEREQTQRIIGNNADRPFFREKRNYIIEKKKLTACGQSRNRTTSAYQ